MKPELTTLISIAALSLPATAWAQDTEGPRESEETATLLAKVAELEAHLQALSDRLDEDELADLLEKAEMTALAPADEERPEDRTFIAAGRALQKTNPEISVSGDLLWELPIDDDFRAGEPYGLGMPIRAFGVLNEDFPPKSAGHGIARPVIFVVDSNGVIRGRFSESNSRDRPDIDAVLNTLE